MQPEIGEEKKYKKNKENKKIRIKKLGSQLFNKKHDKIHQEATLKEETFIIKKKKQQKKKKYK